MELCWFCLWFWPGFTLELCFITFNKITFFLLRWLFRWLNDPSSDRNSKSNYEIPLSSFSQEMADENLDLLWMFLEAATLPAHDSISDWDLCFRIGIVQFSDGCSLSGTWLHWTRRSRFICSAPTCFNNLACGKYWKSHIGTGSRTKRCYKEQAFSPYPTLFHNINFSSPDTSSAYPSTGHPKLPWHDFQEEGNANKRWPKTIWRQTLIAYCCWSSVMHRIGCPMCCTV